MALSNMLDGVRIAPMHLRDCRDAVAHLSRSTISVVICDTDLSDDDWKDVLQHVLQARSALVLIVTSRVADHSLWAEVLNLGGYDVLTQPFDGERGDQGHSLRPSGELCRTVVPASVRIYFRVARHRASISSGDR